MHQDQGLDRNALVGIFLITLVMGLWLVFFQPTPPPAPPPAEPEPEEADPAFAPDLALRAVPADTAFAAVASGEERLITVETDRFTAVLSTRGATLRSVRLARYQHGLTGEPVELVSSERGALAIAFTPPQGSFVDSRALYFVAPEVPDRVDATALPQEVAFEAPIGEGGLRFVYTFRPGSYEVGLRIEEGAANLLTASGGFELLWDGAIPFSERDVREDASRSGAYARSGGEIEAITLNRRPEESIRLAGNVEWVSVKSKYFLALVQPRLATEGAELEGRRFGEPGQPEYAETFTARILHGRPRGEPAVYDLYLGPLDLQELGGVADGVYRMVDYGFGSSITRPIAEYVINPLFRFFGGFIPNYGLVIILFAFIVKIALYPLTKASYKNTARMRELQPKLEAIKEKYADDPQKQQEALLKLYRETGINPLAGCLPLLLQYPIIIALWQYFQNSILIRQESFLWAADLSAPDPILQLPFWIPLYGDFVAGFTLIMGISMILQMRVAMPPTTSGPQAKIFMYVLPLVLFVIFNRLASGLSLYYLVFNLLSIVQQKLINRSIEAQGVAEAQPDPKKIRPATSTNGRAGRGKPKRRKPAAARRR